MKETLSKRRLSERDEKFLFRNRYFAKFLHPVDWQLGEYLTFAAEQSAAKNKESFFAKFGFELSIGPSSIENAGRGVFLKEGTIDKGTLVALYPGVVYRASGILCVKYFFRVLF